MTARGLSAEGLAKALAPAGRNLFYLVVALAAVLWAVLFVRRGVSNEFIGSDFEGTLWNAAIAIREGVSPYPAPVVSQVDGGTPALYPPLLMLLVAPATVLPWWLGFAAWTALVTGTLAAALYILGVRDVRCYAIALVSAPVTGGLVLGNATLLLVPLLAVAWRWRDRWLRAGVVVGLAIAVKLLVWPLFFWLLGTRRYRAFAAALVATCVAIFAPWAALGFDGFRAYPDLLRVASEIYGVHSYSVTTMLSALGVPTGLARDGAFAVGLVVGALAFVAGRRSTDEASISLAVLGAILGAPIVWMYNYALLFVPLAIARPRFSGLWLVPLLFSLIHRLSRSETAGLEAAGHTAVAIALIALVAWGARVSAGEEREGRPALSRRARGTQVVPGSTL